jgi:hypothetical protein
MIIKNQLRPTTIRTNSRYRGQTEIEKYANFVLESVHDLKLLGSVMDRNEYIDGSKGHTDFINDNFAAYVSGGADITANINTASVLYSPLEDLIARDATTGYVDVMTSEWTTANGCTKTKATTGVVLSSTGLQDPAGILTVQNVKEGDIIYIRMAVKFLSGDSTSFTVGSHDINQNTGDVETFPLPQNGTTIYIDKRLYCKHREPISINIDVQNTPATLQATSVEIFDVEVRYILEDKVAVLPVNTSLKSRLNSLESDIRNIINNI